MQFHTHLFEDLKDLSSMLVCMETIIISLVLVHDLLAMEI